MDNLPLLVRFAVVARIVVCSQEASGRESPDRSAAANPYVRRFFAADLIFFGIIGNRCGAGMNADAAVIKQISRAGRRRTVAQPLRTWDASRESLRNFTGKAHRRVTALMQFYLLRCIFPGSLRRLT